jgi:hypothetical protein
MSTLAGGGWPVDHRTLESLFSISGRSDMPAGSLIWLAEWVENSADQAVRGAALVRRVLLRSWSVHDEMRNPLVKTWRGRLGQRRVGNNPGQEHNGLSADTRRRCCCCAGSAGTTVVTTQLSRKGQTPGARPGDPRRTGQVLHSAGLRRDGRACLQSVISSGVPNFTTSVPSMPRQSRAVVCTAFE